MRGTPDAGRRSWRRLVVIPVLLALVAAACDEVTAPDGKPIEIPIERIPESPDQPADGTDPAPVPAPDGGGGDAAPAPGDGTPDEGAPVDGGDGTAPGDSNPGEGIALPAPAPSPAPGGGNGDGTPPAPGDGDAAPPEGTPVIVQPGLPSPADPAPPGNDAEPPPLEGRPAVPFPTNPAPPASPPPPGPDPTPPPDPDPVPDPGPVDPGIGNVPAWSSPSTWPNGQVPAAGANVTIPAGMKVRIDGDVRVGGISVDGELYFDPRRSAMVRSSGNIVIKGLLHMQPNSTSVDHTIEFTGVNESRFVGGGMQPIASDVGLWVMDSGRLDLQGTPRRGWTNLTDGASSGTRTVQVRDASGWQVGDRVVLTPTAPVGQDNLRSDDDPTSAFHDTTIASISGNSVTFASPTPRAFPKVAGQYTPELANLTRNVSIQGTNAGNSHVFIHAMQHAQSIRWVALDKLGVRNALGRYPLHFHHAGMGSKGSLVEGVVTIDGEHHAIVPHESHGITMRDLVAYNSSGGDAFWWDEGDSTSDLLVDHVLIAGSSNSAFYLGRGTNMTVRNSVAVGVQNQFNDGGFEWENGAVGNWIVNDVIAHNNNSSGVRVWQNADIAQVVDGYVAYHNYGAAIDQGAYSNRYTYANGHYYGNREGGVLLRATSDPLPISFENTIIDSGSSGEGAHFVLAHGAIPATQPAVLRNVEFRGRVNRALIDFQSGDAVHRVRCIDCSMPQGARVVNFGGSSNGSSWLEVVTSSRTTRYDPNGSTRTIARPVRSDLGDGIGLTAEYFNNPNLTGLAFTNIMPGLTEEWEWDRQRPAFGVLPAHHTLSVSDGSSARLTGKLEIGASEAGRHTIQTSFGGGIRVWIGGQLIIDDWNNTNLDGSFGEPFSSGYNTTAVDLGAGRHDIKVELRDTTTASNWKGWFFDMYWSNQNVDRELIPRSQLHPTRIPNNDPVPTVG